MTELRSAIHLNNENMQPARSEGGREPLQESAWGQSQLQQENRVLVRCALKSKPQKTHVMQCYLNVKGEGP